MPSALWPVFCCGSKPAYPVFTEAVIEVFNQTLPSIECRFIADLIKKIAALGLHVVEMIGRNI